MNEASDSLPLHQQNPLERFSNRAVDYARYRPSYSTMAIAQILSGFNDPHQLVIADVGAGTGISSRLLADQGATILALEPNPAMQAAALPHPRVTFRTATAEHTGLGDRSIDLVTCCQSFHWFEPTATLAEFHRILKPGGRVALMWNDRDRTDPFTHDYTELIRHASDRAIFERPDRKSADALAHHPGFTHFQLHQFTTHHAVDRDGLLGLALSASYVPKQGTAYEQLRSDLDALYQRWVKQTGGDRVTLTYRTKLYLAETCSEQ